jgi:hypothetical protein
MPRTRSRLWALKTIRSDSNSGWRKNMTESAQSKRCKVCDMEIPAEARKCHYCRHWQNKLSFILLSPIWGILLLTGLVAFFAVLFGIMMKDLFRGGEEFRRYVDRIVITDSKIEFGYDDCSAIVAVLGHIKNATDVDWTDVRFAVDCRDAQGNLMDTGQDKQYSFEIPANEEIAFKVSFRREFPQESYSVHSIRILSAKDKRARL